MRAFLVLQKSLKQQLRDKAGFWLSLLTVPFFVIFYWLCCSHQQELYRLAIVNADQGLAEATRPINLGRDFISLLEKTGSAAGDSRFSVNVFQNRKDLNQALINNKASIGLIIPEGFSRTMRKISSAEPLLQLKGEASQPAYYRAKDLITQALYSFKNTPPLTIEEVPIGLSGTRSHFDIYVPGLLVFAVIMMIFSASMAVSREIEACTIDRLKMTPLTTVDLLAGISALHIIQGLCSISLTFLAASALGFKSAGSAGYAFLVSGIACFASVGTGMVIGAVSKTQNRAFLISSVVMFLLVLFSGVVLPRPEVNLFQAGSYQVSLFDFLPTTHMAKGLEKILTLGLSPEELLYETVFLTILSVVYFGAGILFFNRLVLNTGR